MESTTEEEDQQLQSKNVSLCKNTPSRSFEDNVVHKIIIWDNMLKWFGIKMVFGSLAELHTD